MVWVMGYMYPLNATQIGLLLNEASNCSVVVPQISNTLVSTIILCTSDRTSSDGNTFKNKTNAKCTRILNKLSRRPEKCS